MSRQDDPQSFDDSPRPAKRRRVAKAKESVAPAVKRPRGRPKKNITPPVHPLSSDSDVSLRTKSTKARSRSFSSGTATTTRPATKRAKRRSTDDSTEEGDASAKPMPKTKKASRASRNTDSDGEERAVKVKKPKHIIHHPTVQPLLSDVYLSQAPPPQSSDPSALRGPIWIQRKPAPQPVVKAEATSNKSGAMNPRVPSLTPAEVRRPPVGKSASPPAPRPRASEHAVGTSGRDLAGSKYPSVSTMKHPSHQAPAELTKAGPKATAARHDNGASLEKPCAALMSLSDAAPLQRASPTDVPRSRPPLSVPRPILAPTATFDDLIALAEASDDEPAMTSKQHGGPLAAGISPGRAVLLPVSPNINNELNDLPSDAFASSSDSDSPEIRQIERPDLQRGPLGKTSAHAMKQTTLFGGKAVPRVASQAAKDKEKDRSKPISWPAAGRDEKPTHHELNLAEINTWVYPTNLGNLRDYQFSIVSTGLFHNLLVALPTGLGKTFIAATIMLNWYRWTKSAQIIFVAPTKPLVAQQVDACFHTVGIPRSETVMLTGEVSPAVRERAWSEKRVFFMTPQTIQNDLAKGICDPKRVVLLVVDEAHRATGNYSYVGLVKKIRMYNPSFRILALTATPGSKVDTVQQVIDALNISRVEIRTEQSIDIKQYVHDRAIDTYLFDYSDEQQRIMGLFSAALQPQLDRLCSLNATYIKDPMKLSAYGMNQQQQKWAQSDTGRNATQSLKGMARNLFSVLASLAHAITMLKFHGIGCFFRRIKTFKSDVETGVLKTKPAIQIKDNENFHKMFNTLQTWTSHVDFVGHPKMEHLRSVILNHFMDAEHRANGNTGPVSTRVMVFAQFRDSAEEIVRVLKRNDPMLRPTVFVGQAASQGSAGMDQKTQQAVIDKFKDGTYNTLVATSIGEEGLDIGEVDLIICYDANASPIRMLQRMGRTGRKRQGKIALLLMRDKEELDFKKAQDNYEKIQELIASSKEFSYHEDRSFRILPRNVKPIVDKRVVEIPLENSQTELPIPTKAPRGKKKKIEKKFHMPDNVITGFVRASKVNDEGVAEVSSDEGHAINKKAKRKSDSKVKARKSGNDVLARPEPDRAPLPFLEDVLLNKMQERELERKYQYVTRQDDVGLVRAPMPETNLKGFKVPSKTSIVGHGRSTMTVARTLQKIREVDNVAIALFKASLHLSDLESDGSDNDNEPAALHTADNVQLVRDDSDETALPAWPVKRRPKALPAKQVAQADMPSDEEELPSLNTLKKSSRSLPQPKLKSALVNQARNDLQSQASRAAASKQPKTTAKAPTPKPQPKPRKQVTNKQKRALHRVSSAMEGAPSSSPPPTPVDMRLPSQGIALGSGDTSGEDLAEGDPMDDSDLADFVVGSDFVEYASSSAPGLVASRGKTKARAKIFSSQSEARAEFDDEDDADDDDNDDDDGEHAGDEDDEIDPETLPRRKRGGRLKKRGFDPGLNERLSSGATSVAMLRVAKRKRVVMSDSDD